MHTVKTSRDAFYQSKFESLESDPKQTFKEVIKLLGWDCNKIYLTHSDATALATEFEIYYDTR